MESDIIHTKMMNLEKIKPKIEEVAKRYKLTLMVLFGSQVDKKYLHEESDIDIAYKAEKPLSLREEAKLIVDLMPVFRTKRIDLASLRRASPLLMKQIADKSIPLYEKEPSLYDRFYLYAIQRHKEAKPLFEMESRYVKKVTAEYSAGQYV